MKTDRRSRLLNKELSYDYLRQNYPDIREGARLSNPYMMPYEMSNPIYV